MLRLALLSLLAATSRAFQPTTPSALPPRAPVRTALSAAEDADACTVQILMSDTGGGHRASANALRDAFAVLHATEPRQFPLPIECDIVDIYTDYGRMFPYNQYVAAYKIMAEYSFLWKWFYEFGATPFGLWLNDVALEVFCFDSFKECLTRNPADFTNSDRRADMIVSVHPLCQDLPLKILNELDSNGASRAEGRTTPFATVVTDLGGAHPTWFNDGVDKCFVPSDVLREAALARDVKEGKIVQYGLPIRQGFWGSGAEAAAAPAPARDEGTPGPFNFLKLNLGSPGKQGGTAAPEGAPAKPALRDALGLADLPTVLIVGGGDGMGGIVSQAQAVGDKLQQLARASGGSYQMVVVCGNNQAAQTALAPSKAAWDQDISVSVQGFVNNMDEFMRASDVLVTKAGPGTIAEAAICGLPCILSSFLPGQEEGNVPYVVDAGFGCYEGSPDGIAATVERWLGEGDGGSLLAGMREKALEAARPAATLDIARELAAMVYAQKGETKGGAKEEAAAAA